MTTAAIAIPYATITVRCGIATARIGSVIGTAMIVTGPKTATTMIRQESDFLLAGTTRPRGS